MCYFYYSTVTRLARIQITQENSFCTGFSGKIAYQIILNYLACTVVLQNRLAKQLIHKLLKKASCKKLLFQLV